MARTKAKTKASVQTQIRIDMDAYDESSEALSINEGMDCCALAELSGTGGRWEDINHVLYWLAKEWECLSKRAVELSRGVGALIFNDATKTLLTAEGAAQLAQAIRKARLGRVDAIPTFKNPNTGNWIKMYVWTVDHEAFQAWAKRVVEVEGSDDEEYED